MEKYPPTGKDTNSKKAEQQSTTIDSLIRNLVDFEKVEVQTAIEKVSSYVLQKKKSIKGGENEEPAEDAGASCNARLSNSRQVGHDCDFS